MSDLITISSSALQVPARVIGFRGTEEISRPYEVEIFISLRDNEGQDVDLSDAIGAKAKLVIDRTFDLMPPFVFGGVLASIELLHELDGHSLFRAVLVPRLWQLGLSKHSRMFTNVKVTDVITTILDDNGISDYELRLGSYEKEEHITQYHESDLDFISRWMEREGIFYYFEHGEDGVEKLILSDSTAYDPDPIKLPTRYHPQIGQDHSAGGSFRSFTCKHSTVPTKVMLADYDYGKPKLAVAGKAPVLKNGAGEVSVYGQRFFTPSGGERLANIRAEELMARQVLYRAKGHRMHLRTGYTFTLDEHPRAAMNQKYLTIRAVHHGNQGAGHEHFKELLGLPYSEVYHVEIDAIPAKTQYRAESRTTWPRIHGYENGFVDGPAESEYAQIDDQGRYNLKFKFDESNLYGGKATTWVRMMQPHGGSTEGFHFPLRKGTEVICAFLGGDVDRPVITGVVPTAITPSKVVASNHTQNIIQTGSENYITMEDKKGAMFMNLFCPISSTNLYMGAARPNGGHGLTLPSGPGVSPTGKRPRSLGPFNFDLRTTGTGEIHTGSHLNVAVGGEYQLEAGQLLTMYANADWHVDVNGAANEKYWTTFTKEVVGNVNVKYDAELDYTVHAKADEKYQNTLTQTVTQLVTKTYNNGLERTVNAAVAHEVYTAGHHQEISGGDQIIHVTGNQTNTVTQSRTDTITADWNMNVTGNLQRIVNGEEKVQIAGPEEHFKWASCEWKVMGLKSEFFVGGKFGLTVAASAELKFGMALEFNGAVTLKTLMTEAKVAAMEEHCAAFTQKTAGTIMHAVGSALSTYGATMMAGGFTSIGP